MPARQSSVHCISGYCWKGPQLLTMEDHCQLCSSVQKLPTWTTTDGGHASWRIWREVIQKQVTCPSFSHRIKNTNGTMPLYKAANVPNHATWWSSNICRAISVQGPTLLLRLLKHYCPIMSLLFFCIVVERKKSPTLFSKFCSLEAFII